MEHKLTRRDFVKGLAVGLASASVLSETSQGVFGEGDAMKDDDLYYIQTVRGRIKSSQLGMTLIHEHILVDFIGAAKVNKDRYDAVYMRSAGGKHELVIKGVAQIDFVFAEKILMFAQKYYKFRGHKLSDWARFFLGYNKLDKDERHVWEYWEQLDFDTIDIDNPELYQRNGLPRIPNKGIEFMLDYNLIDVKICVDLDDYFKVTKKHEACLIT